MSEFYKTPTPKERNIELRKCLFYVKKCGWLVNEKRKNDFLEFSKLIELEIFENSDLILKLKEKREKQNNNQLKLF